MCTPYYYYAINKKEEDTIYVPYLDYSKLFIVYNNKYIEFCLSKINIEYSKIFIKKNNTLDIYIVN